MKITFVIADGFSLNGGDRVVAEHAARLHSRGHDVLVVSTKPRWPEVGRRKKFSNVLRKQLFRYADTETRPSHFDNVNFKTAVLSTFGPVLDRHLPDADVVIATWWKTAEWVRDLSTSKGVKVHFVQHHEIFEDQPRDRVEAVYRFNFRKIVVAPWLCKVMKQTYHASQVDLVEPAVSRHFYAGVRTKQIIPQVGLMYSYSHWKGVDLSVEAFKLARRRVPNLRLVCFGSSTLSGTNGTLISEFSDFSLRPSQDEIRRIYSSCDAWLFGSRCEGYGLPILEAMSCGTPVIGTPTGAAPDFLKKETGILLNSFSAQEMADAIVRIANMPEPEWCAMSDRVKLRVNRYTWDDASDLFENALLEACDNL